jgi:hypothetical protein
VLSLIGGGLLKCGGIFYYKGSARAGGDVRGARGGRGAAARGILVLGLVVVFWILVLDFYLVFIDIFCRLFIYVVFFFCLPTALAFPCFDIGLFALPLCGAAPTFLCRPQRKVGKRKRAHTASF